MDGTGPLRRRYLGAVAAGMGTLAGCFSTSDGGDSDTTSDTDTGEQPTAKPDRTTVSEPSFEIEQLELESDSVVAGERIRVTVTVANEGDSGGETQLRLEQDRNPVGTETVTVAADSEETVTFVHSISLPGEYELTVNGQHVGDLTITPRLDIHVSTDGDDAGSGSPDDPLATIQTAFSRARPGATIRVASGQYNQGFETVRAGTHQKPITLTGPATATVTGDTGTYDIFKINHSHIHLTGLTFDGQRDPDKPDDPEAYAGGAVHVNPEADEAPIEDVDDVLLRDVVVEPDAIGNCRRDGVKINFTVDIEVGEFEVIGPMGLDYLLTEDSGYNGEVVYVGRSIGKAVETEGIELDPTRDVHVHHIDNSAGHEHAELVDVKPGTSNVLVEYCTDGGGAGSYKDSPAIGVKGREITVRFCRFENVAASGIRVASWHVVNPERSPYDVPEAALDEGRANEIYRNVFRDIPDDPINYMDPDAYGPRAQRRVCGNESDGDGRSDSEQACDADVPVGEGSGHTGGDSPWT
jgi:hypothetical protein